MEIYLNHPLVVWCILAPVVLVIIVGTFAFLVISFLPSPMVEDLAARFKRKGRN
jgi:hypothetical protein